MAPRRRDEYGRYEIFIGFMLPIMRWTSCAIKNYGTWQSMGPRLTEARKKDLAARVSEMTVAASETYTLRYAI
ncbi:hypothetical protein AAE478_006503 [Parahypoxylon ruwenzoriense]